MHSLNDHETPSTSMTWHGWRRKRAAAPIIARAAEILLKCAGFLQDTNAANRTDDDHYRTYYAIDVDTIMLYLQPDRKSEYMDVFGEGPKSRTSLALTFLLGEFLFGTSEPLSPGHEKQKNRFLIIPPHDQELWMTLEAMHNDVLDSATSIGPQEFKELTDAFAGYEMDSNEQALLATLEERFTDLVELFHPYRGPKAGIERLASLPMTTFLRIDAYCEDDFVYLDPITKDEDRRTANQLIGDWKRRLQRYGHPAKPPYAVTNDAKVLASIEYINTNLRGKEKKLVLVTGSHYVFRAAKGYKPWPECKQAFDEMYLRHPQAFLAHESFFPEPATFNLIDWLNLLLPAAVRPRNDPLMEVNTDFLHKVRDRDYSSIQRIIESLERAGRDIKQILEEWRNQISERANAQYTEGLSFAEKRGATELASKLKQLRKSGWSIAALRELLLKEALASTSTLYSLTAWIGLWSKSPGAKIEGVPELRFDGRYASLIRYCQKVINLQRDYGEFTSPVLEDVLTQYEREVRREDPSLYIIHLINALAFIAKGHWHAALTLAITAMNICSNLPPEMSPSEQVLFKGREAAYLACIATRRFAINRNGLEKAEKYLDQACALENEDAHEDIRFIAERLTIRTIAYNFDIFGKDETPDPKRIGLSMRAMCSLISESDGETDPGIRLWVQRITCTNLFTLLLIAQGMQYDCSVCSSEQIEGYLGIFARVLAEYRERYRRDDVQYSALICDVSTAVWHSDQTKRKAARGKALNTIRKWDTFNRTYTKARLEMLERLLLPNKRQPDQKQG